MICHLVFVYWGSYHWNSMFKLVPIVWGQSVTVQIFFRGMHQVISFIEFFVRMTKNTVYTKWPSKFHLLVCITHTTTDHADTGTIDFATIIAAIFARWAIDTLSSPSEHTVGERVLAVFIDCPVIVFAPRTRWIPEYLDEAFVE